MHRLILSFLFVLLFLNTANATTSHLYLTYQVVEGYGDEDTLPIIPVYYTSYYSSPEGPISAVSADGLIGERGIPSEGWNLVAASGIGTSVKDIVWETLLTVELNLEEFNPSECGYSGDVLLRSTIQAVVCVGRYQGFDKVKIEISPKESKWSKFESTHDTQNIECP